MTLPAAKAIEAHVLGKIAKAQVIDEPYPHILVDSFLPDDLYAEVVAAVPPTSEMERVSYPGTGFGKKTATSRDYGFRHRTLKTTDGPLGAVREVLASDAFARALLDKFATTIPADKHRRFDNGNKDFSTVFDLQVDLEGYAIAPHPDIPSKLVTFQIYLSSDESLAAQGTYMCVPKDHDRVKRGRTGLALAAGRVVGLACKVVPSLYAKVERSRLGETLGIGDQRAWFPWSWFDVAKTAPALPNNFFAFAPNERSYHAVTMDGLVGERPVIRGFIRAGADTSNWIAPRM